MTNIIRRFLAHPVRFIAVVGSVLVLASATALSLIAEPTPLPGLDATPHPTDVLPTHTGTTSTRPTASLVGKPDPPGVRTKPTTSTPVPAATSPGVKKPDDLLKRQDPLPPGVPDQVQFFLGGGPSCVLHVPPGPTYIEGPSPAEEIPTEFTLCFYGFNLAKPLTVTITSPSGVATKIRLPPDEHHFSQGFQAMVGKPVGPYLVTAEQENAQDASLAFTLQRAKSPRLWLVKPPEQFPPGIDFDLYLGGFPPRGETLLHVYRTYDDTARYRTSFTAPVDAFGEAHIVIDTKPDDPPGCYVIISTLAHRPGSIHESGFCLRSTGAKSQK